jgi:negative regulator of replication initiation
MAIDKRRPQSRKKKRLLKKRELNKRPRAVGRYLIVLETVEFIHQNHQNNQKYNLSIV